MLWKPAGNLQMPRWNAAAVRLPDGQVLLVGGIPAQPPQAAGEAPREDTAALSSVEIYNPATNTWRSTTSMSQARYLHTATLLQDGRVLVVGGWSSLNSYEAGVSSRVEIFDPRTETWNYLAEPEIGRVNHTATLLNNGRVLIAGGEYRYGEYLDTIFILNP
jgi:N-acetylneuraminic acid mutarotase